MAKLISCQCGQTIHGEREVDVIHQAREHIRRHHPELVDSVTRDQLVDWIEDDGAARERAVSG